MTLGERGVYALAGEKVELDARQPEALEAQIRLRDVSRRATAGTVHFRRNRHLTVAGQIHQQIMCIEQGWAAQVAELEDGRRQITAFYTPGEFCEPEIFMSGRSILPIIALTPVVASLIPLKLQNRNDHDVPNFLHQILQNSQRQTSLIIALGRKAAAERLACLFVDLVDRMARAGRVVDGKCPFHLTQQDMADATGMTAVHVNRVLHTLRADGFLTLEAKILRVLNPEALRLLAASQ